VSSKEKKGSHDKSCQRRSSKSKQKKIEGAQQYSSMKQQANSLKKGKNLRKWHNHYVSNSEFAY
jgi:hypothetical protein